MKFLLLRSCLALPTTLLKRCYNDTRQDNDMIDCSSLFLEGTSGPPLTEKDINDFEREYNTVVPPAYRELLLCYNGGILTRRNHALTPDINLWLWNLYSIGDAPYSLTPGENGIDLSTVMIRSWRLPEDIFIICQMGHSFYYLKKDASRENSPVYYVITEIPGAYKYYQLSDTLEEFIDFLYSTPEDEEMNAWMRGYWAPDETD